MLADFQRDQGKRVAFVSFWRWMGGPGSILPPIWFERVYANGSVPVITWLPMSSTPHANQAPYSLSAIAAGRDDVLIRAWALQLGALHRPVFIRFAHEMNGNWYSWDRQPHAFIAAWRHVHNIFTSLGATNVKWVWCPNTEWDAASSFDQYYPGNKYVDWIGLDSYNRPSEGGWHSLAQLLGTGASYADITRLSPKPFMISEFSSAEAGLFNNGSDHSKAQWIQYAFAAIRTMTRVQGIVWLNDNLTHRNRHGCCDWRIESSPSAMAAYRKAVSSPLFRSRYP